MMKGARLVGIMMKNFYQTILSNSNFGKRTEHLTNLSNISRACNKKFGGCIITEIIKQILRERERENGGSDYYPPLQKKKKKNPIRYLSR